MTPPAALLSVVVAAGLSIEVEVSDSESVAVAVPVAVSEVSLEEEEGAEVIKDAYGAGVVSTAFYINISQTIKGKPINKEKT